MSSVVFVGGGGAGILVMLRWLLSGRVSALEAVETPLYWSAVVVVALVTTRSFLVLWRDPDWAQRPLRHMQWSMGAMMSVSVGYLAFGFWGSAGFFAVLSWLGLAALTIRRSRGQGSARKSSSLSSWVMGDWSEVDSSGATPTPRVHSDEDRA